MSHAQAGRYANIGGEVSIRAISNPSGLRETRRPIGIADAFRAPGGYASVPLLADFVPESANAARMLVIQDMVARIGKPRHPRAPVRL